MQRDWKYVKFVLEAVAASPVPFSRIALFELVGLAKKEFGDQLETELQIQATVLQLWYGEYVELIDPKLGPDGMRSAQIKRLTWSGYDLLEERRRKEAGVRIS